MGGMCTCLGGESEPPTPLDAEIETKGGCGIGLVSGGPRTQRIIGFILFGAKRPNFDFVAHDNGETYIATFRAMYRGKVMGFDSNPIPKAVFDEFRIIKRFKRGDSYAIRLDTNGHNLDPYISKLTQEDFEQLGIVPPEINI